LVENDGNPIDKNGRNGNKNNMNMGDQIQYANEAFKDTAVLQGKLQAQQQVSENYKRELF
jgi:hypothetical protein